jgi:hypothetical protein
VNAEYVSRRGEVLNKAVEQRHTCSWLISQTRAVERGMGEMYGM